MNTSELPKLPVPVLSLPRWRVNFRPQVFRPNRIPSLPKALEILEKTSVRLRGWDFPHISKQESCIGYGNDWVASWSDFMGHVEYWRFYQSSQFLYFGSVREVTETEWHTRIRQTMKSHLDRFRSVDLEKVPGFFSIVNFVYTVTEVFEFAARLCQAQVYEDPITIRISLHGIKGFLLAAEWNRVWHSVYAATEEELCREVTVTPADLVAASANESLSAVTWFFEHFGWLQPPIEVLREDQQKLLTGRI